MNVFEKIISKSIDELAESMDEHWVGDNAPWDKWFDDNYCNKCDGVTKFMPEWGFTEHEFAYCELHDKCRFFQDMEEVPSSKQIVKMWLESEE